MGILSLIQIMTTSKCPGLCSICPYETSWHRKHPGYMSNNDFENILTKIKEFDPDFSELFAPYLMQDFLTDKNIIKRIETIFDYFPKCYMEISTNAMLLTPKLSEEIIETILKYDKTNRSRIWLSHHAVDEETYKTLMRRNNYKKTLQNIIDYLKINNGRLETQIRSAGASRDNSMFYFSKEQTLTYFNDIIKENDITTKNLDIMYFTFHNRAGNLRLGDWDGNEFHRTIDEYHPFNCWRYQRGLHVLYNSDIVPCCMIYNHESVFGNLKEQSLKEIWSGEKRKDFIDKATGLIPSEDNFVCRHCQSPGG